MEVVGIDVEVVVDHELRARVDRREHVAVAEAHETVEGVVEVPLEGQDAIEVESDHAHRVVHVDGEGRPDVPRGPVRVREQRLEERPGVVAPMAEVARMVVGKRGVRRLVGRRVVRVTEPAVVGDGPPIAVEGDERAGARDRAEELVPGRGVPAHADVSVLGRSRGRRVERDVDVDGQDVARRADGGVVVGGEPVGASVAVVGGEAQALRVARRGARSEGIPAAM